MLMQTGKFIVVDGGEGCGKTTMVKRYLAEFGGTATTDANNILTTREPGGAPYAEQIRTLILGDSGKNADDATLFSLFWAARADHMHTTIAPALAAGKTVISDRFDCTTYAYQIFAKKQTQLEELFWATREAVLRDAENKPRIPDMYIFFDVDPRVGKMRKQQGNVDWNHLDLRAIEFYDRVREGHKVFAVEIAKRSPQTTVNFIDAGQSQDEVYAAFVKLLQNV